jgi:hypothetical protein
MVEYVEPRTYPEPDDETRAVAEHLKAMIAADPFPPSPRLRMLRAILAKLDPDTRPKPLPAPKAGEPSLALARRRRQRR